MRGVLGAFRELDSAVGAIDALKKPGLATSTFSHQRRVTSWSTRWSAARAPFENSLSSADSAA
jgi:aminoglycoside phosphotransferase (APT) family kinase protein